MNAPHFASATELAAAIRARRIGSRELLELYLQRIAAHDPQLNAVVTLDAERALLRAAALDEQLARGEIAGPLHGLPITIKDAFETAGLRTTGGAREHAEHVPARNALAVQRLVDAGAVVFGKTNVPAYSGDVQTYNELFGVTRNPHDPERTPGGSSGGAAVAVAAGFTAFELGSDIGGSIRTPAHFSGVFGHKPSYGLIPSTGSIPPAAGRARGARPERGRSARPQRRRPAAAAVGARRPRSRMGPRAAARAAAAAQGALADYRLAVWLDDPAFPVDAEPLRVLRGAIDTLRAAGAAIDERARPAADPDRGLRQLPPPARPDRGRATCRNRSHERLIARAQQPLQPDAPDDEPTRYARSAMARHVQWLHAHERRMRHRARMADFFERYDALLCPVNGVVAIPHDHTGTQGTRTIAVNGKQRPYLDLLGWIALATSTYLPATVVPVGRGASGLPVGLQIIGPHHEDLTTLDIAGRIARELSGFTPPAGY